MSNTKNFQMDITVPYCTWELKELHNLLGIINAPATNGYVTYSPALSVPSKHGGTLYRYNMQLCIVEAMSLPVFEKIIKELLDYEANNPKSIEVNRISLKDIEEDEEIKIFSMKSMDDIAKYFVKI